MSRRHAEKAQPVRTTTAPPSSHPPMTSLNQWTPSAILVNPTPRTETTAAAQHSHRHPRGTSGSSTSRRTAHEVTPVIAWPEGNE